MRREWAIPITVEPVGYVRVEASDDEVRKAWGSGGVKGEVVVKDEFSEAMKGLKGFSHVLLIAWFHKAVPWHRKVLKVKPRRLLMYGFSLEELPLIGVFASDSPDRPNPLGIDVVKVLSIEGNIIEVDGLDFFDGTPILDIKPYTEEYIPPERMAYPDWYLKLREIAWRKSGLRLSI